MLLNGSVPSQAANARRYSSRKRRSKNSAVFSLPIELGGEPTVEGIAVVDPLLSCQGDKPFNSDSEPSRLGILLCTLSSPLCCLIPTPCRGHGHKGEDQRLKNFNRFKTGLWSVTALAHFVQFSNYVANRSPFRL